MDYTRLWLDYEPVESLKGRSFSLITLESGRDIENILSELTLAVTVMTGSQPLSSGIDTDYVIRLVIDPELDSEGYTLIKDGRIYSVRSGGHRGLIYGSFRLIYIFKTKGLGGDFKLECKPHSPIRMADHWDNMDGSIERGYSGASFFFKDNKVVVNERTADYARLMASIGINAVAINNVNVRGEAAFLLTERHRSQLIRLAEILDGWGISLYLSINFASTIRVGGMDTADPADSRVQAWWSETSRQLFSSLPGFGGYLVKADSEGEFGPFAYGRTHAEGANMLARAVKPYGGRVIWRCFVYNCQQDWRDNKTDRAAQSYDGFIGLDGKFDDNVILQIKNGPMDFQVREPVHPLFGGLKKTNIMLEFQIAQEYTGQQRHVCYLMPAFKEVLDFDTHSGSRYSLVRDIVAGKNSPSSSFGICAVMNTGSDPNWTGHDLAAANLFGFGALAFDPTLSPEEIAEGWILLTYGRDELVLRNMLKILLSSLDAYEKYTAPLGIGWMVNPNHHFGPNVDGYEYDRWGTYHRASHSAIGRDRSDRGTGYARQYPEPLFSLYNEVKTCPEELLLFFHRVRFDHIMRDGRTLLQRIYSDHFEGADTAAEFVRLWQELEGRLDGEVYERVLKRLRFQAEHSTEWRDRINTYFYRLTEIPDALGRKIYE